jgi:hypothetical protein
MAESSLWLLLYTCIADYVANFLRRPNRNRQQRRVVIATPIAESSITIDGVTAVVDSGLARAPCYSPATGISRLLTQQISQDSAEQRRGRAGRTQPGKLPPLPHHTLNILCTLKHAQLQRTERDMQCSAVL